MTGADAQLKPIVLCADDYAQDAGISAGIRALAEQGRLGATSAMVLSPRWREDAAPLRALRGQLDVGLHLDWTSPFAQAAGHGMGLGAAMRRALLGGFDVGTARAVVERQLDAFEAAWGAPPDHVDGHQHVHQFAGIRDALVDALQQRYGGNGRRPWLRLSRAPRGQRDLKARVIAVLGADALENIAVHAGLTCAPAISGIYGFDGDEAAYARRLAGWLASAPAATVVMCHPGLPPAAPGEAADDPIAAARQREWRCLAGDGLTRALAAAGARVVRGSALYSAAPA